MKAAELLSKLIAASFAAERLRHVEARTVTQGVQEGVFTVLIGDALLCVLFVSRWCGALSQALPRTGSSCLRSPPLQMIVVNTRERRAAPWSSHRSTATSRGDCPSVTAAPVAPFAARASPAARFVPLAPPVPRLTRLAQWTGLRPRWGWRRDPAAVSR